jgi:hypothetical protein
VDIENETVMFCKVWNLSDLRDILQGTKESYPSVHFPFLRVGANLASPWKCEDGWLGKLIYHHGGAPIVVYTYNRK